MVILLYLMFHEGAVFYMQWYVVVFHLVMTIKSQRI